MANTDLIITERSNLVAIADAVRANSDITEEITLDGIVGGISYVANYATANASGGIDTSDATASAGDILQGETAYVDGEKITGTIPTKTSSNLTASGATVTVPAGYYASQTTKSVATVARADTTITTTADDTNDKLTITASNNQGTGYVTGANKTASTTISLTANGATVTASDGTNSVSKSVATATQATPSVSIDSAGKITATATQTAGYVSAGTKSGTKQLTTQAAKTVTPTKSSQTAVASGVYTTGAVTVAAIPSQYITTTDATASAGEIMSGETAYVNGSKVTGTFTIDNELTTQDDLIAQIQTALEGKAAGGTADPVLQTKTVTPSTSIQTVEPDSGYDGLSQVTVNAMPTATQATPSISVSSSGLITASATQTAGYVSAGTKSATKQLTTQAAKTITPSTSSQTAVAKNVYTTGAVTVAAIPSTYVKPTTTKSATTYTPTTSNQTIAAGTYCSGVQTIKGDSNLKAENIRSGVSIFGINGSYAGSGSGGSSEGGASVEMCTGTITVDAPNMGDFTVYAVNESLTASIITLDAMSGGTFTVAKGTIIAIYPWSVMYDSSGGVDECFPADSLGAAFRVTDDFELIYEG